LTVDVEMSGVYGLIHGGLEVDDQLESCDLLDRQIARPPV
jgi:hypothetical protein